MTRICWHFIDRLIFFSFGVDISCYCKLAAHYAPHISVKMRSLVLANHVNHPYYSTLPTATSCWVDVDVYACLCDFLCSVFIPTESYPIKQLEHNCVHRHTLSACIFAFAHTRIHTHTVIQTYVVFLHIPIIYRRLHSCIVRNNLWHELTFFLHI